MENPYDQQVVRKGRFLREQVYRKLKESILNVMLEPNQRLIEEKLAAEMGTSRTPVKPFKSLKKRAHSQTAKGWFCRKCYR